MASIFYKRTFADFAYTSPCVSKCAFMRSCRCGPLLVRTVGLQLRDSWLSHVHESHQKNIPVTASINDTFSPAANLHARHMFGKSKKCRNVAYFPWWAHGVTASACTAVAFRLHPFECPAPAVLTCFPNRCPVKLWLAASLRMGGGQGPGRLGPGREGGGLIIMI